MAGWSEGHLQEDASQGSLRVKTQEAGLRWSDLVRHTSALYQSRFGTFFLIALPPAVLAYLCQFIQRAVVHVVWASGWMPPRPSVSYSLVVTAVALFEGALYWVIGGFLFAAIASNVLRGPGGADTPVTTAYGVAGRRLGTVAAVTLVIWALFLAGRGILCFAALSIVERLHLLQNPAVVTTASTLVLLPLCGLLSRLGLAIPVLMDDRDASLSQSLRRSIAKTENWEVFFMALVAATELVRYAADWLVKLALTDLADRGLLQVDAHPWVQSLSYVAISAIVVTPIFIAFALLYRESRATEEIVLSSEVG